MLFSIFVYCFFFFFAVMMILVYFAMLIKAGCDTQSNAKYHTTALFDDIEIAFFLLLLSLARSLALSLLFRFFCTQYFFNVTLRLLIFNHTIHIHTQYKPLHKRTRTLTYSVNHTMLMFLSLSIYLCICTCTYT